MSPSAVTTVELNTETVKVAPGAPVSVSVTQGPSQAVTVDQPAVTEIVTSSDQKVSVQQLDLVGQQGPQGLPGRDGIDGQDNSNGQKNFAIADTRWEFDHHLGFPPAVMLYDVNGVQIIGAIVENTDQRTVAEFYFPVAGSMSVS